MSIWNRLPHTVDVYLVVEKPAKYNETKKEVDYNNPLPVRCFIQMVSSEETFSMGKSINSVYRIYAKEWPGQFDSVIRYKGRTLRQIGDADDTSDIERVGHVEILVESNHAAVKTNG